MKQAILLHGTGGSDTDYFWFEDTKQYLEDADYTVWWPLLPNTDNPNLVESREFIEKNMPELSEDAIVVAHSSACPLILNILQYSAVTVSQVVLVAGYYQSISDESTSMLPDSGFDWGDIKPKAEEFIFINSDNDPWKCTDDQARIPASELSAPLIVNFGEGHMGSGSFSQPYKEFPLLKRLLP
jgi:predicted alpha/beta hydrolase family esterase